MCHAAIKAREGAKTQNQWVISSEVQVNSGCAQRLTGLSRCRIQVDSKRRDTYLIGADIVINVQ